MAALLSLGYCLVKEEHHMQLWLNTGGRCCPCHKIRGVPGPRGIHFWKYTNARHRTCEYTCTMNA